MNRLDLKDVLQKQKMRSITFCGIFFPEWFRMLYLNDSDTWGIDFPLITSSDFHVYQKNHNFLIITTTTITLLF